VSHSRFYQHLMWYVEYLSVVFGRCIVLE